MLTLWELQSARLRDGSYILGSSGRIGGFTSDQQLER